jgi:hypothetical protein
MNTTDNVARAAQHLIAVHGNAAEEIALTRAESATGSNRDEVAIIWRRVAAAVRGDAGLNGPSRQNEKR